MEPKHRGWSAEHASAFAEPSAAVAYRHRPDYPVETIELLAELARGAAVLDAGCGPGSLSRPLAPLVDRVDAVDVSGPMIAEGRAASGGDARNLRWLEGRVEDVSLGPPYALVVAGDSVHWFDWEVALPRLRDALAPAGLFAVVQRGWDAPGDVHERLGPIYARHGSANFAPLDPVHELERRGLFTRLGSHCVRYAYRPTTAELLAYHHSMSGFVIERLADPDAFDRELLEVLETLPSAADGRLDLSAKATVVWGRLY